MFNHLKKTKCLLFYRLNIHPHAREIKPEAGEILKQMTAEERRGLITGLKQPETPDRNIPLLHISFPFFRRPCSKNL